MASTSMQMTNRHQIRSLSLPSKLNSINQRIEENLRKFQTKEEVASSTSEKICIGLSGLSELYGCVNDVLALPFTQQALSLRQYEICVGELLKGCSTLLNDCSTVKDTVLEHTKSTKELISSLKSSKVTENEIAIYNASRKEIIRRTKQVICSLKQLDNENFMSLSLFEERNYDMSAVIKSLRCVSIINLSVFETLLSFLSKPVAKPKHSLVSKLMNKGSAGKCEAKSGNELSDVDVVVQGRQNLNEERSQVLLKRLKDLEGIMEGIEDGLRNVRRELTETKACLMNIVSF